jgi:branched-chain amino acid transport system permease protein
MGKQRVYLRQYAAIAIFALAYLALGFAVRNSYYQLMMTLVLIWATLGLGWNMLSGYSGMISFGHAAFFGLGAYTVTIAFVKFGITPWLGIPLGVIVGVVAGVLIGIPTFGCAGITSRSRCSPTRSPCSTCSSGSAIRKSRCR